jgi:type I restriction enzyme S subunit
MVGSEQGGGTVTAMETAIQEEALQRRYRSYPAYKDSGVEWLGEIPEHWEIKRLRSTVKSCQNGVWGDEPDGLQDIACVRVADFDRVSFLVNIEDPTLRSIEAKVASARGLKQGDLLLEKSGGGENQPVGAVVLYDHCLPAVCSNFVARVVLAKGFDSRYMTYLHAALYSLRINTRHIKQSTGIQNLDSTSYLDEAVGLPSESEQRTIATFLNHHTARIDALVAKKQRLIELLQEQRTSLITRAVTRGMETRLDSSQIGNAIFPLIPLDWEMRKLRRVLAQKKRPVEVQQDSDYREIGIRSWGRGIFHKVSVKGALLEEKSIYKIEPGDFVLNIVFAWEGAVAIASDEERGMVGSHRFPTFLVSADVNPDYLLMVFQVEQGRWLMEVNSPGAAGRNKTIRLNQFLDEEIPFPPLSVQREIVLRVREQERRLADLKGKLDAAINHLNELRSALISAAVTGKIDVREEVR